MQSYYFYSEAKAEYCTRTMGEGRFTVLPNSRTGFAAYTSSLTEVLIPPDIARQLTQSEKIPEVIIPALRKYDASIDKDTVFVVAHSEVVIGKNGKATPAWGISITDPSIFKHCWRRNYEGLDQGPLNRQGRQMQLVA